MLLKSVKVPKMLEPLFSKAEQYVSNYFKHLEFKPENGVISIEGERYILVRASSMSIHFLDFIKSMYPGLSEDAAIKASSKILFDMAKSFGISDAQNFHKQTNVEDPIEKLSTGPVHFAYTGWANVDIHEESAPSPDDNYFLVYDHPNTFEADSWIKKGQETNFCTCFMNAGYSSGWCQESFGIELIAHEITCRAKGDKQCRFIMARAHRIDEFINKYCAQHPEIFKNEKDI